MAIRESLTEVKGPSLTSKNDWTHLGQMPKYPKLKTMGGGTSIYSKCYPLYWTAIYQHTIWKLKNELLS